MGSMDISSFSTTTKTEISSATRIRRDLLLAAVCLLATSVLIFTEWQRQVKAFDLSIQESLQEYAESLEKK